MHLANERRRYIVTSSLIGRTHKQNDPWLFIDGDPAEGIFNPASADPKYTRDPKFVITALADVLAPNGARPSADKKLTTKLHMFFSWNFW